MARPKLGKPVYRLRQRGRYWTLSWTDSGTGKTVAVSTGQSDKAQAEVWRDQFIAGLKQPPPPPPQPLISQIIAGYIADAKRREVQAPARLEYAAAAIGRHIGNLEPHMLLPPAYCEMREAEGVSDGTIRREIGVLRAALTWGTRQQPPWIDRAPYIEAPPSPPPRERWLTRAEIDALLAGAGAPHVWLFIMLAYHTAARAGAILDLTWDQVDLEHRRIDYRRPGRRATNKQRAIVPINNTLLAALRSARVLAIDGADDKKRQTPLYVIEWRDSPLASIKRGFIAACERAGIEDCSPHTLRHTAATHMVMAGVPLAEVARMLGDSEEVVERVYGKHSPDYLRRAADALAGDPTPRLVSRTSSEIDRDR